MTSRFVPAASSVDVSLFVALLYFFFSLELLELLEPLPPASRSHLSESLSQSLRLLELLELIELLELLGPVGWAAPLEAMGQGDSVPIPSPLSERGSAR